MEPARLQRLLTMVDKALALQPDKRRHYLTDVCGEDTVLRGEVGQLLESVSASEHFWEEWRAWNERHIAALFQEATDPERELAEEQLGPWRLLRLLGRGGMGTVWLAERADGSYQKQVALKLLHRRYRPRGLDIDQSIRRFEQERQILAQLDHPHVARLYDGGVTGDGLPWLAMEYIDGLPITAWCRQQNGSLRRRLHLFEKVCEAIRYAHRNLIVHRDLKPDNILITKEGHVKILDFGIAKLLDDRPSAPERVQTQTGLRAMSLTYAAPEQITGEPVTTATDVYALGLLLYELLTGTYPYDLEGKNLYQIEQVIRTEEPTRPSAFQQGDGFLPGRQELRGDLDAITLKALRKEPDGRYENAGQLLDDIHRYQKHQPVLARRGTVQYRLGKWLRRHRWGAVSGLIVVLSLVMGIGVALWQARQASQSAERATAALAETEQALSRAEALREFLLDLFQSAAPDRPRDQLPTTEEILALGAERAMDKAAAEPAERFSMLLTIGQVYRQQHWNDQARPLLEAAVDLAREHQEARPEDLALALWQLAVLLEEQRDLHQSETLLLEAEAAIEGMDAYWNTFAKIRAERGWVEYRRGSWTQVIALNEPLYLKMQERDDVEDHTRLLVMTPLLGAHSSLGNLSTASELSSDILDIVKRSEGPESLTYAVQLANSVQLEYNLGRFSVAETKAHEAIALYNQIYDPDQPVAYRAVAQFHLAYALFYAGRFDEALDALTLYNEEQARVRGSTIDAWEYSYLNRGTFLARMHRWQEAEQELRRARSLFDVAGEVDQSWLINLDALFALTLCRQEKVDEGAGMLADVDARLNGQRSDSPTQQALIHEARACCYFQAEQLGLALQEAESAIAADDYPGRIMYRAERRILRARILAALDRRQEAKEELHRTEQAYLNLDLGAHPHFAHVEAARRELFGD